MTVTPKAIFSRSLTYTELLDGQSAGPFVGIHLGEPGKIYLRRTAQTGYIESDGAPDPMDGHWVFVHLPHLQECLRYLESEAIDIIRLNTGALMLRTVNAAFETEMQVHTVARSHSGFKIHNPGAVVRETDVAWLRDLRIKNFVLAMPPIVNGTNLILVTHAGTVVWDTEMDPDLPSSPRDTFLRAMADVTEGSFNLTHEGYFAASFHDMTFCIAGHTTTYPAEVPTVEGSVRLTEVNAARFTKALKDAANVVAQGAPITITPRGGIITRNTYLQPVRFGMGDTGPFMPFDVFERSAKTIADALEQARGDFVTLYRVPSVRDRIMFARGNCLVVVQGAASSLPG